MGSAAMALSKAIQNGTDLCGTVLEAVEYKICRIFGNKYPLIYLNGVCILCLGSLSFFPAMSWSTVRQ